MAGGSRTWAEALRGFGADKATTEVFVNLARAYRHIGDLVSAEEAIEQGCLRYPDIATFDAERARDGAETLVEGDRALAEGAGSR